MVFNGGDFVVHREREVMFTGFTGETLLLIGKGRWCSIGETVVHRDGGGVHGGDFVVHRDGEVVFTGGDSVVHRDGEVVFTATPGVLQLRGLRPDQSGTYSCTADNGIGPPAVGSVDVVLQCESAV